MRQKLLAFALAMLLVLGLVPGLTQTAYAADFTAATEAELLSAITNANESDVIIIGANITLTADLTVNKNVAIISSGAKIIAGGYKIIIPAGSSVYFGQSLSVTGSTATGHNDGLIVVAGRLTLGPGSVSVTNSYTGGIPANSTAVYVVTGGWLTVNGGTISDTATGGNALSAGIFLNGGEADISGGLVTGSGVGIESRSGAWLRISGGTVSGNSGVFFEGSDGGTMYMTGGTVNGTYAAVRVVGSPAAQSSRIIGGTISASAGYGVEIEQFSDVLIAGCTITGTAGEGGIFVESGSTLNLYRNSPLSVSGGVRAFDGTIDDIAFLSALPEPISAAQDESVSFSLTGAETTFVIDEATTASLNASLSADTHTVTINPTAQGSKTLVLTSAVDLYDEDYGGDYSNCIKLTIPVEITEPAVVRGTWLDDQAYYDSAWYDAGESSFVITNAAELAGFAKLTRDGNDFSGKTVTVNAPDGIDLSAHDWVPAGVFSGTFDGGDDSVTGITIGTALTPETMYTAAGLFGHLASATVRNVQLTGISIDSGATHTGGLAGEVFNCTIGNCSADGIINCYGEDAANVGVLLGIVSATQIESCSSSGSVSVEYAGSSASVAYAGGLCGQASANSALSGCHNTADVHVREKEAYAGGIGGLIIESTIVNCSNSGDISNTGDTANDAENNDHYLGGIAGVFRGSMQLCYNTGAVQGSGLLVFCGGLSGIMNLLDTNSILNSYNTGSVSAAGAETYSGGIVSRLNSDGGIIQNCFNIGMVTGTLSGTAYAGGIICNDLPSVLTSCYYLQGVVSGDGGYNAMAKSVADFHESSTFTGWDFDLIWQLAAGMNRYPTLRSNAQTGGYVYPLSFRITDLQNTAVTGAAVTLSLSPDTLSYPDSNAAGYSSASVSAGNYSYTIKKSGYTDFTGSVHMSENTSAIIPVTLQSESAPTVTTEAVTGITASGAALNGNVTDDGGAAVTERGFVYGQAADPAIGGTDVTKVTAGSGTGSYSATISGLAASTPYHVRSYAINGEGTSYGADVSFTTLAADNNDGYSAPTAQSYNAVVKENQIQVETLPVNVAPGDSTGSVNLDGTKAADFFAAQADTVILVPSIPGVSAYRLEMPASALNSTQTENSLTLQTPFCSIAVPNNMLAGLTGTQGTIAGINIGESDKSKLSAEGRTAVGDRPLLQLTLTLDGKQTDWNNSAVPVTVTIPYTPTAAELANPECIIIWYLDGSGNLVCIPNSHYDADTGMVTFATNHFSVYAVGYNEVSFSDVSGWYADYVDFVAARGIMNGTGVGAFEPGGTMTRGMFVTVLYRLSGDNGSYTNSFADVASGAWYENAAAWAAENGIVSGIGNGLFAPENDVTREQMAVMLFNYAKFMGYDVSIGEDTNILSYNDAFIVSEYAYPGLQWACGTGILNGDDGGNLNPQGFASRAEAAAVLYRLLTVL